MSWSLCSSVKFIILCSPALQLNFPVSSCLSLTCSSLVYWDKVCLLACSWLQQHPQHKSKLPYLQLGLWKVNHNWLSPNHMLNLSVLSQGDILHWKLPQNQQLPMPCFTNVPTPRGSVFYTHWGVSAGYSSVPLGHSFVYLAAVYILFL